MRGARVRGAGVGGRGEAGLETAAGGRRGAGSGVELKEAAGGSVPAGSPTAARVILPRCSRERVRGVGPELWGGARAAGGTRVSGRPRGIPVLRHFECTSCPSREWARGERSLATEANCFFPKELELAFQTN